MCNNAVYYMAMLYLLNGSFLSDIVGYDRPSTTTTVLRPSGTARVSRYQNYGQNLVKFIPTQNEILCTPMVCLFMLISLDYNNTKYC